MTRTEYNRTVDHFSDGVYRFILKMCKSKEMAEDVVQDSFMKLWEEVEYIAYDKAKSFLFSTAYHRMIDVLRRETKFGDIENVADRAGDVQEGYTGLQEILDMALEKLPPVQKTVILLRDYEAYSYEEIAGITGLNESQVKVYIFRARAFMKAYIRRPDVVVQAGGDMITRENYEIYFIDYMDGNLSERERAEVEAFLLVHPDLQEQLDGMGEVRLEVPTEVFGKKEEIKQAVREREMEYYAIAVTEGVITDEERAWVDENTDKKVFEREVDVYAKIKVKPDPACRFEGKAGLYRKSGVILLVKRYAAIAAVVALGIVVAIYTTRKEEFSMEDIPMTVVKTETLPLPQVLEPEKAGEVGIIEEPERMMIQPTEQREAPVEVVERVIPPDVIELKKQLKISVEIMAPQPSEILTSPYEGLQFQVQVKEQREPVFQLIDRSGKSDNIVNNLIDAGRNVLERLRSKERKDMGNL